MLFKDCHGIMTHTIIEKISCPKVNLYYLPLGDKVLLLNLCTKSISFLFSIFYHYIVFLKQLKLLRNIKGFGV